VSGATIVEKFAINIQKDLRGERLFGTGQFETTAVFEVSTLIPSAPTTCPRNFTSDSKLTFGELDSEILVLQNLHDLTQMFCVFFMCFAENQDVIYACKPLRIYQARA
jgi:hypothetical protein